MPEKDRLSDFTRDWRVLLLSGLAAIIGAVGAVVAYALVWLIGVITNLLFYARFSPVLLPPTDRYLGHWIALIPPAGGLIIGLMARYGSDKIRGHGIPEALEAILIGRSRMQPKVALLKPLSSAISIGSGGPFGAEGPIIMTGGAFGSLFAQLFHVSATERKTLLVAGAAAGMAGIFATPVAAVLLAVELLLFEWKPRSVIPVAVAAAVAAALRPFLLGNGPLFAVPPHAFLGPKVMLAALLVGLLAGLGSGLMTLLVYACEDLFKHLPIHWMWWPAIGGLVVGVGGAVDPRVLGVGYDTIHLLLEGKISGVALVKLLTIKALVWSIALGSGTSGGVLAPLLMIGGALGGIEAHWISVGDPSLWAMVSMAAVMGGAMRSPFTAIVFILELTHDVNALPALLVGCFAAHAVTVLLMRRSILTEKIARRGHHITCEYGVDAFELQRVRDVMDRDTTAIPANMSVSELASRIAQRDPKFTRHHALPIIDDSGSLVGIITHGDVLRAVESTPACSVLQAGSGNLVVAYPDETLRSATQKMLRRNIGRLPVVTRDVPQKLVGYLGRTNILGAKLRELDDEDVRESRWTMPSSG